MKGEVSEVKEKIKAALKEGSVRDISEAVATWLAGMNQDEGERCPHPDKRQRKRA